MFALLATLLPYIGDHQAGEIELITDPAQASFVVEQQKRRLLQKGLNEAEAIASSRVGIIAEDLYWIWRRDPVQFPSGAFGTYNSLSWKAPSGVAVLPILPDGKVVLNLNFRHATRSWEWELPRGGSRAGEGNEEAARRELREETGLEVSHLLDLGSIAPDSGVLTTVVPVYAGWVKQAGSSDTEESEAIAGIYAFTMEELEAALKQGYLQIYPQGKVPMRDPFLTFALYQMTLRKIR